MPGQRPHRHGRPHGGAVWPGERGRLLRRPALAQRSDFLFQLRDRVANIFSRHALYVFARHSRYLASLVSSSCFLIFAVHHSKTMQRQKCAFQSCVTVERRALLRCGLDWSAGRTTNFSCGVEPEMHSHRLSIVSAIVEQYAIGFRHQDVDPKCIGGGPGARLSFLESRVFSLESQIKSRSEPAEEPALPQQLPLSFS